MKSISVNTGDIDLREPTAREIQPMVAQKVYDISAAEIEAAMQEVDKSTIKQALTEGWEAGIIEEGDSINGTEIYNHPSVTLRETYQHFIDHDEYALVYISGSGRWLQYNNPENGQPLTEANAENFVNDFISEQIQSNYVQKIAQSVREYILDGKPSSDYYELTTEATNSVTPEDNLPDIPAEDDSYATITVKKYNAAGNRIQDNDTVYFKTSHGRLSDIEVTLDNGRGYVVLEAINQHVVAEVTAYDPDYVVKSDTIKIQFAPIDDDIGKDVSPSWADEE
jgi:hypothetical protein